MLIEKLPTGQLDMKKVTPIKLKRVSPSRTPTKRSSDAEESPSPKKISRLSKPTDSLADKLNNVKLTDTPRSSVRRTVKRNINTADIVTKRPTVKRNILAQCLSDIEPESSDTSDPDSSDDSKNEFSSAVNKLHLRGDIEEIPARQKEYNDIMGFISERIAGKIGGCMYISGVPGTGKTLTVTRVITDLQSKMGNNKFHFINVNAMGFKNPNKVYNEFYRQLTGDFVSRDKAIEGIENYLFKGKDSKKRKPIVLLIDEFDYLINKKQDVVYTLLDWPFRATKTQLIVITIANTLNLPETILKGRVNSRIGFTRVNFMPYTYQQLGDIIKDRLKGTELFQNEAIEFAGRKIASLSGDARGALTLCRNVCEKAMRKSEEGGSNKKITIQDIIAEINLMYSNPMVEYMQNLAICEKLFLRSIANEVKLYN